MLAMQFQFEQSQWWPEERLREFQMRQLRLLLEHAGQTVPFYRERFRNAGFDPRQFDWQDFSALPLLTRPDIQNAGDALHSRNVPAGHGRLTEYQTSGSTGTPIRGHGTELTRFFWNAFTLRDHLWHGRKLSGKLVAIRTKVENGSGRGWGPATDAAFETGESAVLNIRADVEEQLQWLESQSPDYLLSHPSNIRALARRTLERGLRLPTLREVRTFGEMLPQDLRILCRRAWGVRVTDCYSTEEVGYVALQCSGHEHYHVQSESLYVEVLDVWGNPCAPGEIGRVVVTTLHNFAMPLVRYALGDYAEVGAPCPCGRGLPALKRILGRQRNMVTLPDGSQHWPSLPAEFVSLPVRQRQVIQRTRGRIDVNLVVQRIFSSEEEARLISALRRELGYPFEINVNYVESLDQTPTGPGNFKYEDFISEVSLRT